jgi:hypothetical protein
MNHIYPEIKEKLSEDSCNLISLIYFHTGEAYFFKRELDTLNKRFPVQLVIYYEHTDPVNENTLQETIEVVLNSNTSGSLSSILAVSEELAMSITSILLFLDVKQEDIREYADH